MGASCCSADVNNGNCCHPRGAEPRACTDHEQDVVSRELNGCSPRPSKKSDASHASGGGSRARPVEIMAVPTPARLRSGASVREPSEVMTAARATGLKEAMRWEEEGTKAFARGDLRSALRSYGAALDLDPSLVAARAGRGGVHLRQGDLSLALEDLDEVLRRDPDHCFALRDRAEVYVKAGRLDLAVADFDRKLGLVPCDGRALFGRGESRLRLGDRAGAIADLALAARLSHPGAKELLAQAKATR